jgi:hypothetical protein
MKSRPRERRRQKKMGTLDGRRASRGGRMCGFGTGGRAGWLASVLTHTLPSAEPSLVFCLAWAGPYYYLARLCDGWMTVANPPSPCSSSQSSALHHLSVRPLVHDGNKKVIIALHIALRLSSSRCSVKLITLRKVLSEPTTLLPLDFHLTVSAGCFDPSCFEGQLRPPCT